MNGPAKLVLNRECRRCLLIGEVVVAHLVGWESDPTRPLVDGPCDRCRNISHPVWYAKTGQPCRACAYRDAHRWGVGHPDCPVHGDFHIWRFETLCGCSREVDHGRGYNGVPLDLLYVDVPLEIPPVAIVTEGVEPENLAIYRRRFRLKRQEVRPVPGLARTFAWVFVEVAP